MTQDTRTRYIILMRHGERTCSHEKRLVGIVEDPLTPRGIQQAYMSGEWLKKHGPHIDEVFASPLQRCIDTAAYAAEPLGFARADVQVVDGLHEIDLGRWENMLLTEAQADDPEAYAAWQAHLGRFVFPDGESWVLISNTSAWRGSKFSRNTSYLIKNLRRRFSASLPQRDLFSE